MQKKNQPKISFQKFYKNNKNKNKFPVHFVYSSKSNQNGVFKATEKKSSALKRSCLKLVKNLLTQHQLASTC